MKKIFRFSIFLLLASCASGGIKSNYNDIEDTDFIKPKENKYNRSADKVIIDGKSEWNVLSNESIESSDISDVESKGIIDEIAIACYEGDFQDAYELIKKNRSAYRSNPTFWNQVGTCYLLEGREKLALLFFNKALEFKPDYAITYNNLGVMYRRKGDDDKAIVAFQKANSLNRYAATPNYNLGHLYLEYGHASSAQRSFSILNKMNPADESVLNGLAVSYLMQKQYNKAASIYKKISENYAEREDVGINMALAFLKNGDRTKAMDILSNVDVESDSKWNSYYQSIKQQVGE